MNIFRAFTFIFEDPHWMRKIFAGGVMIAACIFIIPVPIVLGYIARTMKNASRRKKDVLPDWNEWIDLYKTGFMILVIIVAYGAAFGILGRLVRIIPHAGSYEWILQTVLTFILPVPVLLYVTAGKLQEAFDFEKIKNFLLINYLELFIIYAVGLILVPIAFSGMLVLIVGMVFTAFYSILVRAYLYGNLYRMKKREKLI